MIKVTISPQGEVEVTVDGVKGTSCKDLTRKLEESLGSQTTRSAPTSEMYEQELQQQWRTNS